MGKQQIREATAFGVQPRILIHDNDGIYGQFGKDRRSHLGYGSHLDYWLKETIGIRGIPITPGCPQETPHIERFNRTLREEALNHFVTLILTPIIANCVTTESRNLRLVGMCEQGPGSLEAIALHESAEG